MPGFPNCQVQGFPFPSCPIRTPLVPAPRSSSPVHLVCQVHRSHIRRKPYFDVLLRKRKGKWQTECGP